MKKRYIVMIGLICILLPITLERLITEDKILFIDLETQFTISEWFSFWGSYIGAIGTIFLGGIAYHQNHSLAKANESLNSIQESYFDSISKPTFRLGKSIYTTYEAQNDLKDIIKDSVDSMYPVVLKDYENSYSKDNCWYTRIQFPIISQSDIPLMDFRVEKLKWTINGNLIEFSDVNCDSFCKLPHYGDENMCSICIIYPDMYHKNKGFGEIGKAIQQYIEASAEKDLSEKRSQMIIEISVRNQLGKIRSFCLELNLFWSQKHLLEISRYFINLDDI